MNYPGFQFPVYTFLNGVMAIVKNVPLMAQHIFTHGYDLKFAVAIFNHYWVKKYSILGLFAEISVYPYVSLPLS